MADDVEYLRVKNWSEFQHYKDRNPPWIKLHRTLLDDYEFSCLNDASKAHLILIWLFASQRDGLVPNDPKFLKLKLGLQQTPDLKLFIDHGLLIPEQGASNLLADSKQNAPLEEKRREEKRRGDIAVQVLQFLNEKTGKNFEPGKNTDFILARLREGASADDLRAVVAKKCREWLADPKMNTYLRPATLFNAEKFAQYKGELVNADSVS